MADQEVMKVVHELFVPAFVKRCAERGYPLFEDKETLKRGLTIVKQIKQVGDQLLEARSALAKEALETFGK